MSEEGAMLTQQDYARLRSLGQFDTLEAQYFVLRARLEAVKESERIAQNLLMDRDTKLAAVTKERDFHYETVLMAQKGLAAAEGRVREVETQNTALHDQLNQQENTHAILTARLAQVEPVCTDILRIMKVYHEQAASPNGVDTPDGLEHMGDVWNLFHKWEHALTPAAAQKVNE
jgi:predicted nuclease with TOPRIM domain